MKITIMSFGHDWVTKEITTTRMGHVLDCPPSIPTACDKARFDIVWQCLARRPMDQGWEAGLNDIKEKGFTRMGFTMVAQGS